MKNPDDLDPIPVPDPIPPAERKSYYTALGVIYVAAALAIVIIAVIRQEVTWKEALTVVLALAGAGGFNLARNNTPTS